MVHRSATEQTAVTECVANRDDLVNGCYHGSTCIDASNEFGLLDRYCECNAAIEIAAGLMCEHKVTSTCMSNEVEQVTDQFCVNGGTCVAFVSADDDHPGCICEEGKWEGKHCEFAHGVLFDDALDLFQQRKAEIASKKLMRIGNLTPGAPDTLDQKGGEEEGGTQIIYAVGSIIAVVAVVLAMLVAWRSRKSRTDSSDSDNQSVGNDSIFSKLTRMTIELAPPSDVFLSSRKKEVESDDGSSFMMSPGIDESPRENTDDVELLDAETSKMIEQQFKSFEVDSDDEDEEYESESGERSALVSSVLSCEKDEDEFNDEGNKDQWLPQSGRITINSGKDPLSKLQNGTLEETDIEGLIEDEEFSKSRGGITSLDGEYDDDSDEDNCFV